MMNRKLTLPVLLILMFFIVTQIYASDYDVKKYGAKGDGKTLDTPAINKAIDEANAAGGGTVYFPTGTYLTVSIHLKSNVSLFIDQGATILAANPKDGFTYDLPEPNGSDMYQDFGHTHWQNSLLWGINIQNVSILGTGLINGQGLVRSGSQSRSKEAQDALRGKAPEGRAVGPFDYPNARDAVEPGWGNKAIALKLCRNVIIKDVSILHGGHFAILATGVDNFTIDNLKIDTDRDGMDIDCCKNVRISNCTVNSPFDDGICLKSSYGLGYAKTTENVTITNCQVSGYDQGTLLDGTFKREYNKYSHNSTTGRIKFGTESNGGGFKNITISNCVFEYSRGLALETVDGGLLEDITITNITMRDITNSPIFLRLGARMRGPEGVPVGELRRIIISNVVVYNADPKYSSIISGIPGHDIEDVKLSNIKIYSQGGGTKDQAALIPEENEKGYPEPVMFGEMPAYGFFIRHVKGLEMNDVNISSMKEDLRPPFVLNDVKGAEFNFVKAQVAKEIPTFVMKNVDDLTIFKCDPAADTKLNHVDQKNF